MRWDYEHHRFVMPFAALLGATESVRTKLVAWVIKHEIDVDRDCRRALRLEADVTSSPGWRRSPR
ncbi:hypothetical protein [Actinomadura keratinilytica]|uniref:hypothetical protein n=1 Tax=Actinomadura keratinilytica TaxID=547461 RepID=UPI0036172171